MVWIASGSVTSAITRRVPPAQWTDRKGVYHVNAVDEVTQMEMVVSVEKISERYLIPALEQLLDDFPFVIL